MRGRFPLSLTPHILQRSVLCTRGIQRSVLCGGFPRGAQLVSQIHDRIVGTACPVVHLRLALPRRSFLQCPYGRQIKKDIYFNKHARPHLWGAQAEVILTGHDFDIFGEGYLDVRRDFCYLRGAILDTFLDGPGGYNFREPDM